MGTYVIAELGQNMQGSLAIAKDLIDMVADPRPADLSNAEHYPVNAVKMTKRNLLHEATEEVMGAEYDSPHSFGGTYREHRQALELNVNEHAEAYEHAKSRGLDFIETVCHPSCVDGILSRFAPDSWKIASRDLTNGPLLERVGETGRPVIISTGMADSEDISRAVGILRQHTSAITILHCVSEYPAAYEHLNLRRIATLSAMYPSYKVGYSDHSLGIMAPVAAVALGAEVIEKHVTLERTMRGSDHMGSLERDGLWRMMRDIRNLDSAMGDGSMDRPAGTTKARQKLERSLVTARTLESGETITEGDLELLSPGTGLRWHERDQVVGRVVTETLESGAMVTADVVLDLPVRSAV